MNSILNKSIFVSLAVTLFFVLGTTVYASNISSTIHISENSTLVGTERTYNYDNYRLDITPTYMLEGPRSPGQVQLYTELIRPLYRFGVIKYGEEVKYSGTIIFNTSSDLNVTKKTSLGNCGDGKRYFYFSTKGTWGAGYGALDGSVNIANY